MRRELSRTRRDMYTKEASVRVVKWGDSLAVRLPSAVVEALELKAGDDIEISVMDARAVSIARKPSGGQFVERLRALRGRLPADWKFDRGEANVR